MIARLSLIKHQRIKSFASVVEGGWIKTTFIMSKVTGILIFAKNVTKNK